MLSGVAQARAAKTSDVRPRRHQSSHQRRGNPRYRGEPVQLRTIREEAGAVLYAEGGVGMPTLIGYAIRQSLAGLEWAAGIPGTVGRVCGHECRDEAG